MSNGGAVSQKWLIGVLTAVALAGASGWMRYVHVQIDAVAAEQREQQKAAEETKRDTAVIREKVDRLEQDVRTIKEDQKEQSRKLDELLRRVR